MLLFLSFYQTSVIVFSISLPPHRYHDVHPWCGGLSPPQQPPSPCEEPTPSTEKDGGTGSKKTPAAKGKAAAAAAGGGQQVAVQTPKLRRGG